MKIRVCLVNAWHGESGIRLRHTLEAEVDYTSRWFVDILREEFRNDSHIFGVDDCGPEELVVRVEPKSFDLVCDQLLTTVLRAKDKTAVAMRGMSP